MVKKLSKTQLLQKQLAFANDCRESQCEMINRLERQITRLEKQYDEIDLGYSIKTPESFEELCDAKLYMYNDNKVIKSYKYNTILHKHKRVKIETVWSSIVVSPENFSNYSHSIKIKECVKGDYIEEVI